MYAPYSVDHLKEEFLSLWPWHTFHIDDLGTRLMAWPLFSEDASHGHGEIISVNTRKEYM